MCASLTAEQRAGTINVFEAWRERCGELPSQPYKELRERVSSVEVTAVKVAAATTETMTAPVQYEFVTKSTEQASAPVSTEEGSYDFKPSVVHCSKYGAPCAYEGERHGHWFPGAESDPRAHPYTVIRTA